MVPLRGREPQGISDPEVEEIILRVSREQKVNRRTFDDKEILARLHGALVNEGSRILEEVLHSVLRTST